MVKAKSHNADHLTVSVANMCSTSRLAADKAASNRLQTLTKLLALALFNDLSGYVDVKTHLGQMSELDGLYLVNRHQQNIKPVMLITSTLTDFVYKKLHNKAHLVNVMIAFKQNSNSQMTDIDSLNDKTPNLIFDCKTDALPVINFNKRVSVDCYLEQNNLSVVVNKQHYIDFEVRNLKRIEDLLTTNLLANAG